MHEKNNNLLIVFYNYQLKEHNIYFNINEFRALSKFRIKFNIFNYFFYFYCYASYIYFKNKYTTDLYINELQYADAPFNLFLRNDIMSIKNLLRRCSSSNIIIYKIFTENYNETSRMKPFDQDYTDRYCTNKKILSYNCK